MNLQNKNGYNLNNLDKVNIILGKNGSGKSIALKKVEQSLANDVTIGTAKYISPERGGDLRYDASVDTNLSQNPTWLSNQLRKNQFSQFKQQSVSQFRKLELLCLREIEQQSDLRQDLNHTFQTTVDLINGLLDNVEIIREGSDFNIYHRETGKKIGPADISSGESEIISLGIECLVFQKECKPDLENILFLDEPDVHLHPDLQFRLSTFIKKLVDGSNFRVIIASHSTSLLGAFENYPDISIEFISFDQKDINFKKVGQVYKKILPVFGAHPLSNVFNEAPILLVEGEDDERVWQQATRSAQGRIKLFPCCVDSIDNLSEFEQEIAQIIDAIYDHAVAYSLRDRDEGQEEINDIPPVIRMRLSCRAAENLLLTDDTLAMLNTNWGEVQTKIKHWLEINKGHAHYDDMSEFSKQGFKRKSHNLKSIRNDLMGIMASNKPWEVVVGQAIGNMNVVAEGHDNSLQEYLGPKVISNIIAI